MQKNIILVAGFLVVLYLAINYFSPTPQTQSDDPEAVFKNVAKIYGTEYARNLEKLFRYETAHFKSRQFLAGFSPGMVATKNSVPYGWASLGEFVTANPKYKNGYSLKTCETSAGTKTYVGFPSLEASVFFVAWFLKNKRNGNIGLWNSTDPSEAANYLQNLQQVTAKFN